jgi:hypothetical protein
MVFPLFVRTVSSACGAIDGLLDLSLTGGGRLFIKNAMHVGSYRASLSHVFDVLDVAVEMNVDTEIDRALRLYVGSRW